MMERRDYLKSVVSLPLLPSLPSIGKTETEEEEEWEISSGWFRAYDEGDLMMLKNGDVEHRWTYENYTMWQKATLLNGRFVADSGNDSMDYIADLFDMNIHSLYIDPPFFSSVFQSEDSKVHIHSRKEFEDNYVYHIETHNGEVLEGVEGEADSIDEAIQDIHDFIN